MKKKTLFTALFILNFAFCFSQKYLTKEGQIEIFSETNLFTIEAKNKKVASILNKENGDLVVSTLVRSFKFHEALVEEHFNENYLESHKYPKALFKGKITNISSVDFSKDGIYPVKIEGDLTIHGKTNPVSENGQIIIKNGQVSGKCNMIVSLEKYEIKVEESYKDRIKDEITLKVSFDYQPY